MRKAWIALAAMTAATGLLAPAARARAVTWIPVYDTHFAVNANLGSFAGCDHTDTHVCDWLPQPVKSNLWAYPNPWPDTATQRNYPVGGFYCPSRTLWISGGQLHIRMFRNAGAVCSAAVVPRRAMGRLFGRYTETFRVSRITTGYKSAHLLWPAGSDQNFEVDFPENEWDTSINAFVHAASQGGQLSFNDGAAWGSWHTSEIDWTPGSLVFRLDGRVLGTASGGWVPDEPMDWIIQNESALNGESAPPFSSAQMDISHIAYAALG